MVGEQRDFMREMTVRSEKHTDAMVSTLVAVQGEIASLQGEIADQRKQIQVNTQAVLSVLDRLD